MVSASIGEYNFRRVFGMFETGNLTSLGTRAFISGIEGHERQSVQQLRQGQQAAV